MTEPKKNLRLSKVLMLIVLAFSVAGLIYSAVSLTEHVRKLGVLRPIVEYPENLKVLLDEQNLAFQNFTHSGQKKFLVKFDSLSAEYLNTEKEFLETKIKNQYEIEGKAAFDTALSKKRMLLFEETRDIRTHIAEMWIPTMLANQAGTVGNVSELRKKSKKVRENRLKLISMISEEKFDYIKFTSIGNRLLMILAIFSSSLIFVSVFIVMMFFKTDNKLSGLFRRNIALENEKDKIDRLLADNEEQAAELRDANEKLNESYREYREQARLLEQSFVTAKMSYWSYEPEKAAFIFSERASELLNGRHEAAEMSKEQFAGNISAGSRKEVMTEFDKSLINNTFFTVGFANKPAVGPARYLRMSAEHHFDESGRHTGSDGVIQDITYLKEKELQFGSLEGRLNTLFELIPEVFVEFDETGRVITTNHRAEEIFGYNIDEVNERIADGKIFGEGYRELFLENWQRGAAGIVSEFKRDYVFITKSGEKVPCEVSAKYLFDSKGNFTGATALIWDVRDEIEAKADLARKDQLLRKAVASAGIGLFEHNPVKNHHYWSPEVYSILGADEDRVSPSSNHFLTFIHPDDKEYVQNQYARILKQGNYEFSCRIIDKYKNIKYIKEWGKSNLDDAGNIISYFGIVHDVTDMVAGEKEMYRINRKLKDIQAVAKIGFLEAIQQSSQEGGAMLLRASDELKEIFEFDKTKDLITFREITRYIEQSEQERLRRIENDAVAAGKTVYDMDFKITLPGGKEKFLYMIRKRYLDNSGRPFDELAIIQDISDIRKMRTKLDDVKSEKNLILSVLNESVVYFDSDKEPVWTNRSFGKLKPGDIEAVRSGRLIRVNAYQGILQKNKEFFNPVDLVFAKNEELRCDVETENGTAFMLSAVPVQKNGEPEGAVLSLTDITSRIRFEKELEESEIKFRSVAENSMMGIFIVKGLEVTYVNGYLKELLGYSAEEMTFDRIIKGIIYKDDKQAFFEVLKELRARRRDSLEFNLRMVTKKGEVLYVVYSVKWVDFTEESILVGTITNITGLIHARKRAEEAESIKSNFLANISHEVRTPLNAMVGAAQLLANDLDILEAKHIADLRKMIGTNADSLTYLIEDIMVMAKIESGDISVEHSKVYINEMLQELKIIYINELRANGKDDKVKLQVYFTESDSLAICKADYTRLKQVLKHLLSNAVKFTEEGEITVGYNIRDRYVELFIRDTGVGIDDKKKEKIFRQFATAEKSLARKYSGAGLGLSIAKRLAEMMEGDITFESELGAGSTFYVQMPNIGAEKYYDLPPEDTF